MANIALTQGERYTFAKVNTVPVIIDSTDGAEDDNFFRNDVIVEKSVLRIRDDLDATLQFTSSTYGTAGTQRWLIGIDANNSNGENTFAIQQGTANTFFTTADFRVSGSTIVLDYDDMPTDADLPLNKGTVYRSQSGSQHFLLIAP